MAIKIPPWAIYTIIGVTIFLMVMCLLQILWIRGKLKQMSTASLQNAMAAKTHAVTVLDLENKLTMYSLVIDCKATSALNISSKNVYDSISHLIQGKVANIPNVCEGTYKTIKTTLNKAGFLVVYNNDGANRLADDVMAGNVQYLIINNKMFLVDVDTTKRADELIKIVQEKNIPDVSSTIADRSIFYVYAVASAHNTPQDGASSCHPAVRTFMGQNETATMNDSTKNLNISEALALPSYASQMPCHAMGYKT